MTNRIAFLTVALDKDIREDDAESIVNAIRMIRGVLDVGTNISDVQQWMAYARARAELTERLFEVVTAPFYKKD